MLGRRKIWVTIIEVGHLKVLFITGTNQYGVVSHFMQGMRADLESINIFEVDKGSQETPESSVKNIHNLFDFDFIASFKAVGLDIGNTRTVHC